MNFDLILKNGSVIDVENKCYILADVGVSGKKITAVGNLDGKSAGKIIDCKNKFIAPSYIDAHVHIESSMATPAEFAKSVIKHGTTAVIADPHEIVNVGGAAALDEFLAMCEAACIDIFTVVPSSVPATPYDTNGAGEFLAGEMERFASRSDIAGLGEVMCYNDVLRRDKKITDKIALFKKLGKTIDGHSAGLSRKDIEAYAAAGINNDHECVTFEDALAVYNAGMNVYIREGSAARSVEILVKGIIEYNKTARQEGKKPLDMSRFAFCTDDKHLSTIDREGHIDFSVRKAVSYGLSLIDAVSFASYNPSRYYKLYDRGSIGVDKLADIVVLSDKTYNVEYVVKNGNVVNNEYISALKPLNLKDKPSVLRNSVKYKTFDDTELGIEIQPLNNAVRVQKNQLITEKAVLSATEAEKADMMAVIERYGKNGNVAKCFLTGYGVKGGAVATSVSHDSHNVTVAGDNPRDMAVAVNRLREIGGGYVIAANGKVAGELGLDVGGLMSSADADTIKNKINALEKLAHSMGVEEGMDPFHPLSFVSLPVIPFIRLMDTGLFDVLSNTFIK